MEGDEQYRADRAKITRLYATEPIGSGVIMRAEVQAYNAYMAREFIRAYTALSGQPVKPDARQSE